MQQMMIISDCLFNLGFRDEAIKAQRSENWEFWYDFVKLIKSEAYKQKNDSVLNHLYRAWMFRGAI